MLSFRTLNFAPHFSSSVASCVQLLDDQVGDVMLLDAFEDDVAGFGVGLERGVEDLLLDRLVHVELGGQRVEQPRARLRRARRRLFTLLQQILESPVIGLEQHDRVVFVVPPRQPLLDRDDRGRRRAAHQRGGSRQR